MSWVNREVGFVFLDLPHNASTSIITWLRQEFPGTERVGRKHELWVPINDVACHWTIWCIRRDEKQRRQAMFEKQWEDEHSHLSAKLCRPNGEIEPDRNKWLEKWRDRTIWANRDIVATQVELLLIGPVEYMLLFEDLPGCLEELPFVAPGQSKTLPHLNRRTARDRPM